LWPLPEDNSQIKFKTRWIESMRRDTGNSTLAHSGAHQAAGPLTEVLDDFDD